MIAATTIVPLASRVRALCERALSPDEWAGIPHIVTDGAAERAAAEDLVRRWRKVITARSGSEEAFRQRLETLGLSSEDAWRRFLPASAAAEATLPEWTLVLGEAMAVDPQECLETIRFAGTPTPEEIRAFGLDKYQLPLFPQLLGPFLAVFVRRQKDRGPATASLTRCLLRRMSRVCARTVAYELKLARSRGDLQGSDPASRYQFFSCNLIGSPEGRLRLFETYPVLARLLGTLCGQAIDVTAEVLARLEEDRDAISAVLNEGIDPGPVDLCLCGLSDPHRGGRSTCILRFSNGLCVVYKPRSHGVDSAWARLIDWFNATGCCLPLRAAKIIERDGYGWSEFIAAAECASDEEIGRYYQRQGTLAALIWLLCGQDFHADNFVAAGDDPVPIDLEGLLAPGIAVFLEDLSAIPTALQPIQFSVAGTLMLPCWRAGDRSHLLFQSAGIGGSGNRPWPAKQPAFTGVDTDSLCLEYRYPQITFDNSVPRLAGGKVPVIRFLDRVKAGFAEGYGAILRHRDELLSAASPLEAFRNIECRLFFRDTQDYANLLFWTTAPDILTSGAACDVALESLAGTVPFFLNGALRPEIIEQEKRSLWQHDIPIASGCPSSTDILFPGGHSCGPIVPLSVFEQMQLRLARASAQDGRWQESLIHALFELADDRVAAEPALSQGLDSSDFLAVGREIAEDLVRTAVRQEDGVTWLSFIRNHGNARIHLLQNGPWNLNASAGNALFLANIARATGEQRFETFAREGLACARRILEQVFDGPFGRRIDMSAWSGSFGLVYALAGSGIQLHDNSLIEQAVDLALRHTPERLRGERSPDVLSGAAGSIAVLAWLHGMAREPGLLQRGRVLAEIVRACAVDHGRGGWQVPAFHRPQLGMAHGSAGIAMALGRLYREAGDEWMLEAARAGLAHERGHFHAGERQWPNLQERGSRVSFANGWCAGAPGIGLARLALREQLPDDPAIPEEIATAVEITRASLGGYQHHLCCGESGRIAFLRSAGLSSEARDAALRMVEGFRSLGCWRLQDFSERLPIPGLLGGVAGPGLTLLSFIQPDCSDVLTLS